MTNDNLNNCLSCNSEMSIDDNFCQECGSPREIHEISSASSNGPLEQYRSRQLQPPVAASATTSESARISSEQTSEATRANRIPVNSGPVQSNVENQRTTSSSLKAHTLESPLLRRNSGYQERLNSVVADNQARQDGGFKDILSKLPFPKRRIMPVFVTEFAAGALMLVAVGYAVHYFAGTNAKPVNSLKATQTSTANLASNSISTDKIASTSSFSGEKNSGTKEILGFDNAKQAYENGDYNSAINFMENLFLVKNGVLSNDERTLFDDALFARGRQRLEKQQFRLATSDMLRVSEYYPKYDDVRQYMKDNCTNYKEEIMREGAKAKEENAKIAVAETSNQSVENTVAVQSSPIVSQTKVTTTTVTTPKSTSRDLALSTTSQSMSQSVDSQPVPVKTKSKVESVSQNTQPAAKTWKHQAPETAKSATTAESSEKKGRSKSDDLLSDSSMNTSSVVNSIDSNSTSQANAARIKRIAQKLGGSKTQAKASDEDVAKYNELLAEYFSRGASDGEPPTLNEWVSKGKPEF